MKFEGIHNVSATGRRKVITSHLTQFSSVQFYLNGPFYGRGLKRPLMNFDDPNLQHVTFTPVHASSSYCQAKCSKVEAACIDKD